MDEIAAIDRLFRGDISALEILVHKYQVKAVRAAYFITGDLSTAEDAMQTAFVQVYRRVHQFDRQRPFAPWFFRIVANEAIAAVRRSKRTFALSADVSAALFESLPDSLPSPQEAAEGTDLQAAVWSALEQLSPEQRAVIVLRYYLNYSETEMSASLHVPLGTIRWRIHAAHQRLRGLLFSWKVTLEG